MKCLSAIWSRIQQSLFPDLVESLGPLSPRQLRLVATLELVRIEDHIPPHPFRAPGRPQKDRVAIARAFVLKAVYDLPTTRALLDLLSSSPPLRRICGWELHAHLPSESVFSRAFASFASSGLLQVVHLALVEKYEKPRVVGHLSRDSCAIHARETPMKRPKRQRGRPKDTSPKKPTRLARQTAGMSLADMLADLPTVCDRGCKRNSKGYTEAWNGYKLHVDWADGGIPVSCLLTSASLHDSQVAIPLATMSQQRLSTIFYDLMDSAYDAKEIRAHSLAMGHVPIIEQNPRRRTMTKFELATQVRYNERTNAERGFARLEDEFGGRTVRVRGHAKVLTHLLFGLIALLADQLMRLVC